MNTLTWIATIAQLICAVLLTVVVLFQSGKSAGLSGAVAGVADSFMSKGKSRTLDQKLSTATKVIAGVFVLLTLLAVILIRDNYGA
ncbi:MAG: preprotein translocase subunit SecG [Firmicutes bacterium]|nr:preprotein translocase subunit SecG [Bacillota bacterium]MDY2720305.1 preprotein translocase subunit SecG [Candidatus Faecousia sp.]